MNNGVHTLSDMVGSKENSSTASGRDGYFCAVPMPYQGNNIAAAWAVLTGKAVAVKWPEPGELEDAVKKVWGKK